MKRSQKRARPEMNKDYLISNSDSDHSKKICKFCSVITIHLLYMKCHLSFHFSPLSSNVCISSNWIETYKPKFAPMGSEFGALTVDCWHRIWSGLALQKVH